MANARDCPSNAIGPQLQAQRRILHGGNFQDCGGGLHRIAGLRLTLHGNIQLNGQQIVTGAQSATNRFRIASGRNYRVTAIQRCRAISSPKPRDAPVMNQTCELMIPP